MTVVLNEEDERESIPFAPVDSYSEIDPEFIEVLDHEDDNELEDEPDLELTDDEVEPPEDLAELVPFWASYELHGRNLDEGSAWVQLASEPFEGDFEVHVEGLTAGARWEFRLRLVDQNGRRSAWSEPLQITLPVDFTPPPAPTAPTHWHLNGFDSLGWDGELQGAIPEDFSHVTLRVRQMHPAGDPEGEPGDPRRITNLYEAGEAHYAAFVANVPHRAFLTAVDTTGNESPWSPFVEFTPTPPVDEEAIQQELQDARTRLEEAREDFEAGNEARKAEIEHLNEVVLPGLQESLSSAIEQQKQDLEAFQQEWDENWDPEAMDDLRDRQDTLEGDLTTGLDTVYNQAQQLATAAENNAVGRAAADAQSEYDRLQELAERALSRAGDNVLEDPSFETDYWFGMSWSSGYEASVSSLSRTGDRALELTRVADNTVSYNVYFDTVDVEPDDSWRFSVWYRTTGTPDFDTSSWFTRLQIRDQDNNTVIYGSMFEVTEDYTRAVVTYQVPEGVTQLRPNLFMTWRDTNSSLIIDDIAFQEVGAAAEALRLAEVARQEAEAAHLAAGNAVDVAVTAQDTAAGKADIIRQTTAPTGTAPEGSIWFRYNNMTENRVLIGWWVRESGAWRSQEMDETIIPQVNIGTGTYGDLSGDRLEAHTVRTNHLLVGPRNIITDPEFDTLGAGGVADGWGNFNGGWERVTTSWGTPYTGFARIAGASDTSAAALHYGGSGPVNASLPCVPGEVYKLRFQVLRYAGSSNDDTYVANFRWVSADRSGISWSTSNFASVGNQGWHELEAEAPEGAAYFYLRFYKSGAAGNSRGVGNVTLEKMTDSSLIVRGAVKAEHADFQSFTADQGFIDLLEVDLLKGRLAVLDEAIIGSSHLLDGAITTNKLSVIPDLEDFAPDPAYYEEAWHGFGYTIVNNTSDTNPGGRRFSLGQGSGQTQLRGPKRSVIPGQQIRLQLNAGWNNGSPTTTTSCRMEWYDDPLEESDLGAGARLGYSTFFTLPSGNTVGLFEGTVTVPDYARFGVLYFYQGSTTGGNTGINGNIRCTPMVMGVSIENGAVTSEKVNTLEFFADSGVINRLSVSIARAMEITAERGFIGGALLEDDSITVEKLYVTDSMAAQLFSAMEARIGNLAFNTAQGMELSAGQITTGELIGRTIRTSSNADTQGGVVIDANAVGGGHFRAWDDSGVLSARLGGGENFLRGSIFAGPDQSHGVDIHYTSTEVRTGWDDFEEPNEVIETQVVPRITFHTHQDHAVSPQIWANDSGGMEINPGRLSGSASGSGELRIWGYVHTNRLTSMRLDVPSTSSLQPGGLRRSGPNTSLRGRSVRGTDNAYEMFVTGQSPTQNSVRWSGSATWSYPPRNGMRRPIISGNLSETAVRNWRTLETAVGASSTTGYRYSQVQSHGESGNMSHYYNAVWF